jgi:hypothetical protein
VTLSAAHTTGHVDRLLSELARLDLEGTDAVAS